MAREDFKGRQFTIYLPTPEYLKIWQGRAKDAHCSLNHYIFERVESAGEQKSSPTIDTDELNKLRAENQQLRSELERIRLRDSEILRQAESKKTFTPVPFKLAVIHKIRSGGYWNSAKINRDLGLQVYIQAGYNVSKILIELQVVNL